jgi:hypothetical protein
MILNQQLQADLIGDLEQWQYVPLTPNVTRKINSLLKNPEIQNEFHLATRAYEAIKRWDIFRHFRKSIPTVRTPEQGEEFLKPHVWDGGDWRFFCRETAGGRWPTYFDYCCSQACHWMTVPWFQVAQALFPDYEWHVLTSTEHTGIVCFKEKVIFDPYFTAVKVPVKECMQMWTNNTDADEFDYTEIYDQHSPYSYLDDSGTASYAIRFWKLADAWVGSEKELVSVLNKFIDTNTKSEDELLDGQNFLTESEHLNQDPVALMVLASRQPAY